MEREYIEDVEKAFAELGYKSAADRYLELFPEFKTRLSKFAVGILRWDIAGEINIDNPDDVGKVRLLLKILDQTPWFDYFDNTFNESDPDTVYDILGMSKVATEMEQNITFDYHVREIKNYDDARAYFDVVPWCIVISEESFKEYTAKGNRFYFCENGMSARDVASIPGSSFPRDCYGYSIIAVEVMPDNKIASVTSRWNTDAGDFIPEKDLLTLLG